MARLTQTLLGGFEGRLDESRPLSLSARKAWALVAYLAVPSLRQALFALRRALDEAAPLLGVDSESVRLDAPGVAVDAVRYEQGLGPDTLGTVRVELTAVRELFRSMDMGFRLARTEAALAQDAAW